MRKKKNEGESRNTEQRSRKKLKKGTRKRRKEEKDNDIKSRYFLLPWNVK